MQKRHFKNSKIYLLYTLLFVVISLGVFFIFIKNNRGFIWQSDGLTQHYVILQDFHQMMRKIFENGFPMLSWNMGLGLDVIGQYSYYVIGDPFAYITLLFPESYLETLYSVLVILRIYCVGLSFIVYCRYQKKETINTLIGAIIYTFCGFILYAGIRHPYFTNAVILLPLNLIAVEKLLKENKKLPFIFMTFISAISNYYFFYMLTVVNVLYAITKYVMEYCKEIKDFLKKVGIAIGCYITGVFMASIVLLPTIYAFLHSARVGYEQTWQYAPGFYKNFFMGLISMRFSNWTVVAVSSIVLLMIPILFTKLKEKECRTYASLFCITTIMLMFPIIASVMNGLSFPSNRWVFAYSFILSYIVVLCFDKKLYYSKRQLIFMTICLMGYVVIGMWITKLKIRQNLDFYGAMAVAILIWGIIVLKNIIYHLKVGNNKGKIEKFMCSSTIILGLIVCNVIGTSFALYSNQGKGYATEFLNNNSVKEKYHTLSGKIEHFEEAIKYIKEQDKGLYRIAKCDSGHHNTSLMYDYCSIQTYVSIGNGDVYNLSCDLKDNCYTATRCVNGMDRRTQVMTLLGTKYYICNKKDNAYVPYGYELWHEIGNTKIYKNKYDLAIGTMYDSYLLKEEFEKLTPLQKEEVLLKTAMIENDTDKVVKFDDFDNYVTKVKYEVQGNEIQNNQIQVVQKSQAIKLKLEEIEPDTEVYLSIKNLKYTSGTKKTNFKITASFGGVKESKTIEDRLTSAYYMEQPDFLMNLGVMEKKNDKTLTITFQNKGNYSFDALEVLAVPMKKYEENVTKLKQKEMTDITYGKNFIKGKVQNSKNGIVQITTSYSDGWKAFVDGKEAEVIQVNEGFIGTIVEAGEHKVEFYYQTPYLKLGSAFSVIGIFIFIGVWIWERKNKRLTDRI